MRSNEPPKLIDYIGLCGIRQDQLVDYVINLSPSELSNRLNKDSLYSQGLRPQIISMHPKEKPDFPLSPNFIDVT